MTVDEGRAAQVVGTNMYRKLQWTLPGPGRTLLFVGILLLSLAGVSRAGAQAPPAHFAPPERPVRPLTAAEERANARMNLGISFSSSLLAGESSILPTSLQFGPDGRLYVADVDGTIRVYDIVRHGSNDYEVTATETILLIKNIPNHDDDGTPNPGVTSRQVTGLWVGGTAAAPILYVTSSDPRIGGNDAGLDTGLDTNSGMLSRLTQSVPGSWAGAQKLDLVRGLPRSEENHAPNGMALSPDGQTLYLAQGGHTNMGAPSNNFALLPEYAYAAAILSIDLAAIGESTYDLPTLDDPTRGGPGQGAENDPFGGNNGLNQARLDPTGPVQIHAPGFRNPYDVLVASDGRMYTIDNGPNAGWGARPAGEGPGGNCTNAIREPGESQEDGLHFVRQAGYYGGHPNPTRGNPAGIFGDESLSPVPFALANPVECDHRDVGPDVGAGESGALEQWSHSTNGLVEYTSGNFGGAMQGDLLATGWNSGRIVRVKLAYDASGDPTVVLSSILFNSVSGSPLDMTAQGDSDPFPGTIWVASLYSGGPIRVFEPADFGGCGASYDPVLDEDGDGYSNADEIDNGTDPCSPADVPPDVDGDFLSDLNDPDDDNDGTIDPLDPFAIDPNNGLSTTLPVSYTWDNNAPSAGGLLGLGFTGLMINGSDDYLDLYDPAGMTAGGAGGLVTIDQVPAGDAILGENSQENGFQFGVNVGSESAPFRLHSGVLSPFSAMTPQDYQSMGIFLGSGDQDNYLKFVVAANGYPGVGGLQVLHEEGGAITFEQVYGPADGVSLLGSSRVDLYLTVDPVALTVQPEFAVDGGPVTPLGGPLPIAAGWLQGGDALAVGLISTSFGPGDPFPATWGEIDVLSTVATAPTVRVNSGGGSETTGGALWGADQGYSGGTSFVNPVPIAGTTDDVLYQSERYGLNFGYAFPAGASTCYEIRLHFAEIWFGAAGGGTGGIGSRRFNVAVEGNPALSDYDIFADAGGAQQAVVRTVLAEVTDGTLNLDFTSIANNAKVSAIELIPQAADVCDPPLAITLGAFSAEQQGSAVLLTWETLSEVDNTGFHLYRSEGSGSRVRLNDRLIPSQAPGGTQGARYEWRDREIEVGTRYEYWLEDVSVSGLRTLHGPVGLTIDLPTALRLSALQSRGSGAGLPLLGGLVLLLPVVVGLGRRRR